MQERQKNEAYAKTSHVFSGRNPSGDVFSLRQVLSYKFKSQISKLSFLQMTKSDRAFGDKTKIIRETSPRKSYVIILGDEEEVSKL